MKPALSHHKHEYMIKEVEHGVKMISQEVQFCLYLVLAYSEASTGVDFSYTGFQATLAQFHIIKGWRLERVIRIKVRTQFMLTIDIT